MTKPASLIVVDGVRYVPESIALSIARQAGIAARLAVLLAEQHQAPPPPRTIADRIRASFAEHPAWTFAQHARSVGTMRQAVQQVAVKAGYKSPRSHKAKPITAPSSNAKVRESAPVSGHRDIGDADSTSVGADSTRREPR